MAAILDRCRFTPTAGGTTDWTYSSAALGFMSPALAGAVNAKTYKYVAESPDFTQWEIGEGTWTTGTGVLTRTTVLYNSSGTGTATGQSGAGTKISFTATPQVMIVALKEDVPAMTEANTFSGICTFSNTTVATAYSNGALVVGGGVGIAGAVFINGAASIAGALTVAGGILSSSATAGVGYTTGAGGTVTQVTTKANAVTLNTPTGAITMNNAALASATIVSFNFSNSVLGATDQIVVTHESGGTTGAYTVNGRVTGAGTAAIDVRNNTGGSLSEAIVLRFTVHKSVNS